MPSLQPSAACSSSCGAGGLSERGQAADQDTAQSPHEPAGCSTMVAFVISYKGRLCDGQALPKRLPLLYLRLPLFPNTRKHPLWYQQA